MENWNPDPLFEAGDGSQHDCAPEGGEIIEGKYYFWTETWAYIEGPFDTEEEARKALLQYSKML